MGKPRSDRVHALSFVMSPLQVGCSKQTSKPTKGHGDRYIGSLFRVDEPVPDDSTERHSNRLTVINPSNFVGSLQNLSPMIRTHQ